MLKKIMDSSFMRCAMSFHVNPDNCENPTHYDSYIWQNAISDTSDGFGVTHVFYENDDTKEICGYITLKASSLTYDNGDTIIGYPAIEISELAVDKNHERTGVGKEMIDFAKGIAGMLQNDFIGIKYILVCADPMAVDFYKHLGFINVSSYQKIPREQWNMTCVPMGIMIKH